MDVLLAYKKQKRNGQRGDGRKWRECDEDSNGDTGTKQCWEGDRDINSSREGRAINRYIAGDYANDKLI